VIPVRETIVADNFSVGYNDAFIAEISTSPFALIFSNPVIVWSLDASRIETLMNVFAGSVLLIANESQVNVVLAIVIVFEVNELEFAPLKITSLR
jgi:hypothetical protein